MRELGPAREREKIDFLGEKLREDPLFYSKYREGESVWEGGPTQCNPTASLSSSDHCHLCRDRRRRALSRTLWTERSYNLKKIFIIWKTEGKKDLIFYSLPSSPPSLLSPSTFSLLSSPSSSRFLWIRLLFRSLWNDILSKDEEQKVTSSFLVVEPLLLLLFHSLFSIWLSMRNCGDWNDERETNALCTLALKLSFVASEQSVGLFASGGDGHRKWRGRCCKLWWSLVVVVGIMLVRICPPLSLSLFVLGTVWRLEMIRGRFVIRVDLKVNL